jgi:DEAD/DEAH box helicase domain-containing protein
MIDHIVVDVEIQKEISEVEGGWAATDKLGVSCAVVYEYCSGAYLVYNDSQEDLEALRERLRAAHKITGYNIWAFDFPVIFGLPERERVWELAPKTNDLLRAIWESLGFNPDKFVPATHGGWGLDRVAGGTLGKLKGGSGALAPVLYKQKKVGQLVTYCIRDVLLEKELSDFIDRYGYIVRDDGEVVRISGRPIRRE